jgi:hypothetical protein
MNIVTNYIQNQNRTQLLTQRSKGCNTVATQLDIRSEYSNRVETQMNPGLSLPTATYRHLPNKHTCVTIKSQSINKITPSLLITLPYFTNKRINLTTNVPYVTNNVPYLINKRINLTTNVPCLTNNETCLSWLKWTCRSCLVASNPTDRIRINTPEIINKIEE